MRQILLLINKERNPVEAGWSQLSVFREVLRIWSPQAAGREALTGILPGKQTVCTQEGLLIPGRLGSSLSCG